MRNLLCLLGQGQPGTSVPLPVTGVPVPGSLAPPCPSLSLVCLSLAALLPLLCFAALLSLCFLLASSPSG